MSLPINDVNDFYIEVARGNVTGFAAKEVIGMNSSIAETEDIWNAALTEATITQVSTAALLYISSSSVDDITQTVTITGLDANYDEIIEIIKLTGQTAVATTRAFLRVNGVVIDAVAAGVVYIFYTCSVVAGVPQTTSKVQSRIEIDALQSYNAIYTVPRNKILYLTSLRYASAGSTTTHDVVVSIIRKVFGGANETVKIIKYVDLGTTNYIDKQISFEDQPITFVAKSEFRMQASLAGGTALDITALAAFVEEVIEVVDTTVQLYNKTSYLAAYTGPTTSVTYYLIGLDEFPAVTPSTVVLSDALTTIVGEVTNYSVALDIEVTFDPAYFIDGKIILTNKKAILTVMRCVDSVAGVYYVLAPQNTMFSLGNCKKVKYLNV
jgi:hypothetical protein